MESSAAAAAVGPSYQPIELSVADFMGGASSTQDLGDFLKGATTINARSKTTAAEFGMCFRSMEEVDGMVRIIGAATAPYRLSTSAKKSM